MKRICVFCGSSTGADPVYERSARELGRMLAGADIELVYGGGSVGLMGVLADAVLSAGGRVTGVIPRALQAREVGHAGLGRLEVVETMHERKARMAELSDGFIALPGGIGTMEELFEVWTWGQLGIHGKPCGLLNVAGYYDRLIEFLDHAVAEAFLRERYRAMLLVESDAATLLARLREYRAPPVERWLDLARS